MRNVDEIVFRSEADIYYLNDYGNLAELGFSKEVELRLFPETLKNSFDQDVPIFYRVELKAILNQVTVSKAMECFQNFVFGEQSRTIFLRFYSSPTDVVEEIKLEDCRIFFEFDFKLGFESGAFLKVCGKICNEKELERLFNL